MFRSSAARIKEAVEQTLQDLRSSAGNRDLKACLAQYLSKLNIDYQAAADQMRQEAQRFMKTSVHPTTAKEQATPFWRGVPGRWGGGPVYTVNVQNMYWRTLTGIALLTRDTYKQVWRTALNPPQDNLEVPSA